MPKDHYYFDMKDEDYEYVIKNVFLSKRKKEKIILDMCIKGLNNKEISEETGYAISTILNRKRDLYSKLKPYLYTENKKKMIKEYGDNEFKVVIDNTDLYKIYILLFPNNKVYIGMTSMEENNRWKNGKGYINNENMYNDILKFGWSNIKKNILYKDLLLDEAREKEKELIIHYKSHFKKYGYNKIF